MKNKIFKTLQICLFGLLFLDSFAQKYTNIDSLEVALSQESNDRKKIDILIEITELFISSNPDNALNYAKQTLELANDLSNDKGKLKAYLQTSEIYLSSSDFRTSLLYGNKAKELALDLGFEKEYAESLILIARNLADLNDYEKSSNMNFEALKIFEKLDNKKGIATALNRIGNDFFKQSNFDKALEYTSQALNISKAINDLKGISRGLNNTATIYRIKGEFNKCKANYFEAIAINKKLGLLVWKGTNYMNLGILHAEENNNDSAIYYYRKAEIILAELNQLPTLTMLYYELSKYYTKYNQVDSSLYYANLTLHIGRENKINESIYNGSLRLHQIYLGLKDFENAYKYSSLQYQANKSLEFENNNIRLSQLEFSYESDKLKHEKINDQKRKELIFSLIAALIIMSFLFLYLGQHNRAKRKTLEQKNTLLEKEKILKELEYRNKELATNVMRSLEKDNELKNILNELFTLQNETVKVETQDAIHKISRKIIQSVNEDSWVEFEIRFHQVYNDFYKNLIIDCPSLSTNEKRLCAFLRLNMNSKEISNITGQSIKALESARIRLRKKLGISNSKINLSSFLNKY